MADSKKRKHSEANEGVDAVAPVVPTLQAQVVPQGKAGHQYPEGSVGAFRDFYQTRSIAMGCTYEVAKGIPEFILLKPMSELEKGESWKVGSYGGVRIFAEKNKAFYSIETETAADIDLLCKLIVAGIKGEPKVITLHFATTKSDKLMEEWCEKHDITLKRDYERPDHKASKEDKKTVEPTKSTVNTSKTSSDAKADDAASKNPSSASVKFKP